MAEHASLSVCEALDPIFRHAVRGICDLSNVTPNASAKCQGSWWLAFPWNAVIYCRPSLLNLL